MNGGICHECAGVITGKPKRAKKCLECEPLRPRLTPAQKKALDAYNFAVAQEDRYLGSVFVRPGDGRSAILAERCAAAYRKCKELGMGVEHGL